MAKRFKVASFNVENFAHPGVFFYKRPTSAPYDETSFAEKANWLAALIDEAKPDIIGFEELFSLEAVKNMLGRSRHFSQGDLFVRVPGCELDPGTGQPANLRADHRGRPAVEGPHCGIVSRFPILSCEQVADFPGGLELTIPTGLHDDEGEVLRLGIRAFERPVIRARVELPGGIPTTVLVTHLKSKRPKFLLAEKDRSELDPVLQALGSFRSLVVRAAEAVALRALIASIVDDPAGAGRGEPVILLGDLNDDVHAVTTEIIAGPRPSPFARAELKEQLRDTYLTSVHDIVAERSIRDVAYTAIFDGKYSILDHIHVSREFEFGYPQKIGSVLNVAIFNDHVVDEKLARPNRPPKIVVDGESLVRPPLRTDHGVPVAEIELVD